MALINADNPIYVWLMEEIAAHEGEDNLCFSYDDATYNYIIYKKRPGGNITLAYDQFLSVAIQKAMERKNEHNQTNRP
jgi:hypothetical protein